MLLLIAALAADPQCYTVDKAVAAAEAAHGELIDAVPIPGQNADQMLILNVEGVVQFWMAKDGCMLGIPVPIDAAKDKGTPA